MSDFFSTLIHRLRLNELFKPKNRWIFHCLVVLLAAFYMARIGHSFVSYYLNKNLEIKIASTESRRAPTFGLSDRDYEVIITRNIFDSKASEKIPQQSTIPEFDEREAVRTKLNLKLIGTAVFSVPALSAAIIQDGATQEVTVLHINETIKDATLIRVERHKIHLKRGSSIEYLEADLSASLQMRIPDEPVRASITPSPAPDQQDNSEGVSWISPNDAVVESRVIEEAMKNTGKILSEARVVPNMVNGTQQGFKIFAIKPGSIYEKIGLNNNDILLRVNGRELKGIEDIGWLQGLQNARSLTLDLDRGGSKRTLNYEIK